MLYRPLGASGLKVSAIGFGCWTMGGPNWSSDNGKPIGWPGVNDDDVLAGIKAGLDAGVNHWDNADVYGNGRAERLLGACLRKLGLGRGVARDSQVIATKVGHFRGTGPHAYDPRNIRHQCETSLRNLGVDHIDLYYFHHGTFTGPDFSDQAHDYLHEAAAAMHDLVKQGKVRAVGQSAYSDDDFERVVPIVKPHALQSKANLRFPDFIKAGGRCQALMQKHGCSFVAFGPLDQGILLDKFDPDNPPKFEEGEYRAQRKDFAPDTLRSVREKLAQVKARFCPGASKEEAVAALSSLACRWVLAHPNVCSAIPGFRNAAQAACNIRGGLDAPLSPDDAAWLARLFA